MKEKKGLQYGPETSLGPCSLHICGPRDVRRVSRAFFFCFLVVLGGGVVVLLLPLAVAGVAAADGGNCVT